MVDVITSQPQQIQKYFIVANGKFQNVKVLFFIN